MFLDVTQEGVTEKLAARVVKLERQVGVAKKYVRLVMFLQQPLSKPCSIQELVGDIDNTAHISYRTDPLI